jgi:hypothetical protein
MHVRVSPERERIAQSHQSEPSRSSTLFQSFYGLNKLGNLHKPQGLTVAREMHPFARDAHATCKRVRHAASVAAWRNELSARTAAHGFTSA